jgi:hypothetical protein
MVELGKYVDKENKIIEVGPSYNQIAAKRDGYYTIVVDHLPKEALQRKYVDHNVNIDLIEDVVYICYSCSIIYSIPIEHHDTFYTAIASNVL